MKRAIFLLLLIAAMASRAFAQDRTAGFGFVYNNSYTVYDTGSWLDIYTEHYSFGGYGFFGLNRYFELNLAFLYKKTDYYSNGNPIFAIQPGIYFKRPINLSDTFVLFPTLGIDAELGLTFMDDHNWWWHDIWLRGGLGTDFFPNPDGKMFLRGQLTYGVALPIREEGWAKLIVTHGFTAKLGIGWMF